MVYRSLAVGICLSLLLLGTSSGQDRERVHSDIAVQDLMLDILKTAQVSGSLAFWSGCYSHRQLPDFPKVKTLPKSWEGPPLGTIREMFADDPKMQVTQEPDGTIRMTESDVPQDLLNVRIEHISFKGAYDALDAEERVENAPEVQSFMKDHDIGWSSFGSSVGHVLLGPIPYRKRDAPGDLDNVTVSQALDHVLKTFPGFWVYENCHSSTRKREVFFWYYTYLPGGTIFEQFGPH